MPLNKDCIGRTYSAELRPLTVEEGLAYAEATQDPTPSVQCGEVLPPMFAVNPLIDGAMMVCRDPELGVDLMRLVHGEEDMRFHRLLSPGDIVQPESTIVGVQSKSSGELLLIEHRLLVESETAVTSRSSYFIRAPRPPSSTPNSPEKEPRKRPASRPAPTGEPVFSKHVSVPHEQPVLYAEASRDRNPIHIDEEFAKAAGLPGCILHGLCTMATAAHHVINHAAGGDPTRLARISVRFSALVLPGDTLQISAFKGARDEAAESLSLRVLNQDGVQVLTKARAELRNT
ncbi:MAG: MaoC/PaaZ C-terminal domain-containing protein [Myxococcota bacterium]|nr:MaoC/PaaZ C-terminal domain-containing protein [Myxococcota bacterium]